MNEDVPEGWVTLPVSELLSDFRTGPFGSALHESDYIEGGIPVINPTNFVDGKVRPNLRKTVNRETFERLKEYSLHEGDIIIARRGEMGRCALITASESGWLCGTGSAILRLRQGLFPEFIQMMVSSPEVRGYLSDEAVGSTMDNLNQRVFKSMPILVPPLVEQQRIVARLRELSTKIDICQGRLAKVRLILKRFRQEVLTAACAGNLTVDWRERNGLDESNWRQAQLADVCFSIADGDHQPPPQRPEGVPFLTIGNVAAGQLDFSGSRFVPEEYFAAIKPHRKPARGDVLYTIVATIGVPVLVETDRSFCFQRHIAILKPNEHMTARYLRILLGSSAVVNEARSRATGTAQPTVALGSLRSIPISVPPLAEQEEIVRRVEALLEVASRLASRYDKAKAQVEKLPQAILAKAFRGELVPTEAESARNEGRDFESAAQLLARIKTTRTIPMDRKKRSNGVLAERSR
jgi:type I restriction enzyme, S subunit